MYRDSHRNTAAAFALGGRYSFTRWIHLGAGLGVRLQQIPDTPNNRNTHDADPLIAGTLTVGADRLTAHLVYTPAFNTTPAVAWLLAGYRY